MKNEWKRVWRNRRKMARINDAIAAIAESDQSVIYSLDSYLSKARARFYGTWLDKCAAVCIYERRRLDPLIFKRAQRQALLHDNPF